MCDPLFECAEPAFKVGQPGLLLGLLSQFRLDIRKFVPRKDPADDVVFERPDVGQEGFPLAAAGRQRMLEERQKVDRLAVARGRSDRKAKQHGAGGIGQRFAA